MAADVAATSPPAPYVVVVAGAPGSSTAQGRSAYLTAQPEVVATARRRRVLDRAVRAPLSDAAWAMLERLAAEAAAVAAAEAAEAAGKGWGEGKAEGGEKEETEREPESEVVGRAGERREEEGDACGDAG